MLKLKLHWQILIAILLAVVAGSLSGETASIGPVLLVDAFDFVAVEYEFPIRQTQSQRLIVLGNDDS